MKIWYNKNITIADIAQLGNGNMGEHLGITLTKITNNTITATMPVDHRTKQPYGLLHGGASVVLAETLGSVGSALVINPEKQIAVGLEINANHIRGVRKGVVIGTATPLHIGGSTHIWEIKIVNEAEQLVCVSRLTVSILQKK